MFGEKSWHFMKFPEIYWSHTEMFKSCVGHTPMVNITANPSVRRRRSLTANSKQQTHQCKFNSGWIAWKPQSSKVTSKRKEDVLRTEDRTNNKSKMKELLRAQIDWMPGISRKCTSSSKWMDYSFIHTCLFKRMLGSKLLNPYLDR